jgi:hypothetical protein
MISNMRAYEEVTITYSVEVITIEKACRSTRSQYVLTFKGTCMIDLLVSCILYRRLN